MQARYLALQCSYLYPMQSLMSRKRRCGRYTVSNTLTKYVCDEHTRQVVNVDSDLFYTFRHTYGESKLDWTAQPQYKPFKSDGREVRR